MTSIPFDTTLLVGYSKIFAVHNSQKLYPELSDFYLDLPQSLADRGFAKSLRQIHGYACVFCEPFSIKISAHLFGKNRSVQMKGNRFEKTLMETHSRSRRYSDGNRICLAIGVAGSVAP